MEEQYFVSHFKNTIIYEHPAPSEEKFRGWFLKKYIKMGQSSACSDMADTLLITWPYVSLLYFTKIGVPWEYATVAGESAQAFVCFMEAERRA